MASTAQNSAANSAASALSSEAIAKASMESALASAESAKNSAEKALTTTPEGYNELVSKVGLMDIVRSNDYTYPNTKPGGLRLLELVGATVQNGEPSPSNPIAIENVGDCVKLAVGYWETSGNFAVASGHVSNKRKLPCKHGDVVAVTVVDGADTVSFRCYGSNGANLSVSETKNGNTYSFTAPSGAKEYCFIIMKSGVTLKNVGKITITVNGKHVVQIVEHGKNLFDVSKATNVTKISNNEIRMGAHVSPIYDYHFKEKTKYTFSAYVKNALDENSSTLGNLRIKIKYTDGTSVDALTNNTTTYKYLTFVSDVNKTISNIIGYFGGGGYLYIKDFQIEEGEATPYEPYTEKVATIFLDKPLREGDIFVKVYGVWNVERNAFNTILKSTHFVSDYGSNDKLGQYWIGQYDEVAVDNDNTCKCTHFIRKNNQGGLISGQFNIGKENTKISFGVDRATFPTLDAFKAWIDENNVEVEFKRKTPIYETLDTQSQIALNGLETFKDVTYLEVDSKIKPSGIEVEYGTSQVGAYTLKCMNDNDTDKIERAKLMDMILSLGGNA